MRRRLNPLRAKYDLSQHELAHFMELPLSTVAMWESRQRTLPTKGLLRLALLENAWAAALNETPEAADELADIPEMVAKLRKKTEECLDQAGLLQKMLEAMRALYKLLKTKQKSLELLSEPGTSSLYQGWIEIQQYELRKPLAENSPVKQVMIEHQVKALQAEAAAAAATIETLEQQMEEALPEAAIQETDNIQVPDEPVETTFHIQQVLMPAIETHAIREQAPVGSSCPKMFMVLPHLKRNHCRRRHLYTSLSDKMLGGRHLRGDLSRPVLQHGREKTEKLVRNLSSKVLLESLEGSTYFPERNIPDLSSSA